MMRRRRRRSASSAGFLLVEALATLALSALALAALAALTAVLLRSGDRAAARVETLEIDGRTMAALSREIRRIARPRWAGEGDKRPFVFSGGPDRLLFALTPEQPSGLWAPVVVVYQVEPGGDLLRSEAPLPVGALDPSELDLSPVRRIKPGAMSLRFAYAGRTPGGGEVLTDDWTRPIEMPKAIRIDRIDRRTGAVAASLRVPILIDGEPGCASRESGFCSRVPRPDPKSPDGGARPPGADAARDPNVANRVER